MTAHDEMENAEIESLQRRISLLQDRLTASAEGSSERSGADLKNLRAELFQLEQQLARVRAERA